jgi:putative acyl-CoA dehydrogenase
VTADTVATTATRAAPNQPPPLVGYNLFLEHAALVGALGREGAGWAADQASELGALLGGEPLEWGRLANEHPPRLRTHDRFGNRIDEVEFHPAWHSLMRTSIEHGLHALSWREPRPGAQVARAGLFFLMAQVEAGHGCPVSMTHAAVPALRAQPELAREWNRF